MNVENGSAEQRDLPKNSSVFDILYHDPRRIASFLSQFDTYGQLLSVKAVETEKQTTSETGSKTVTGSIKIAKGEASTQLGNTDESLDSAERVYDPLWKNAIIFLNYLEERSLLCRNISEARIGQFVLVTGALAILDIEMFKGIYSGTLSGLLLSSMGSGSETPAQAPSTRNDRRRNRSKEAPRRQPGQPNPEDILAMIEMMPHTVQLRLFTDEFNVWSMPEPDYMISSPASLMLKNGTVLRGDWSMVGVLDAFPDGEDGAVVPVSEEFAALLGGTPVGGLAAHMGPIARQLLGRPGSAFGMTPLLIFRNVS